MIYLDELLEATTATGAHLSGPARSREFDAFSCDSRRLRPGELFVAIRTAKADGHDYVEHACGRGAAGVLVERELDLTARGVTAIVVDDARAALKLWARRRIERYDPLVVGITGSLGKSLARRAISLVLGRGQATAPDVFDNGSHTSPLGVPVSVGELDPAQRFAVFEFAPEGFGDLGECLEVARPRVGLVTSVDPRAVSWGASRRDLAAEFGLMISSLPDDGWAVLNADDPGAASLAASAPGNVITYGQSPDADLRAEHVEVFADSVTFRIARGGESANVRLNLLGRQSVSGALAAAAVGSIAGLSLSEIAESLGALRPLPGRLCPLPGAAGSLIVDDSQTSNPVALAATLDAFDAVAARRKLFVLGDVLGAADTASRRELGRRLAGAERLVLKGEEADAIARAALDAGLPAGRIVITHTASDAAAAVLAAGPDADTAVLATGPESSRLELVVERLLADPTSAPDVLVRQDAGWKQRVFISNERPTWVEIDLAAIGHNVRRVKEIVGSDVEVLAVLKADAYGHGALRVARTALLHGATWVATACLSEAIALRERGITAPILILGYTPPWQADAVVRTGVAATVFSLDAAQHLSRAAVAQHRPPTPVHVKVDTGMGRLGLRPEEVVPFVEALRDLPGIELQGVFTHFATADSADGSYAARQLAAFRALIDDLAARGVRPRYVHAANSAATLAQPEARFSMVRLGLAMHGLDPSPEVRCPTDFRRALTFKTRVAQVKEMPAGSPISYGGRFITSRPSRIAVIPVGYGDGFRRSPRNWGEVLVRGARAPIVGSVCMDMSMVDVTDVPGARAGDEVILIGRQGGESITAEDVAERLGTINYEVVTQILARVPREVAPSDLD